MPLQTFPPWHAPCCCNHQFLVHGPSALSQVLTDVCGCHADNVVQDWKKKTKNDAATRLATVLHKVQRKRFSVIAHCTADYGQDAHAQHSIWCCTRQHASHAQLKPGCLRLSGVLACKAGSMYMCLLHCGLHSAVRCVEWLRLKSTHCDMTGCL